VESCLVTGGEDVLTDRLDAAAIRDAFARVARGFDAPVHVHDSIGSTNDEAKRLASAGAPTGTLVVADTQTHGRGRSGHVWHSPPGESLYASIIVRPRFSADGSAAFTLAVGAVVARAVESRLPRGRVGIKWPNDVWLGEKKVAGILVEAQVRGTEVTSLVVGVGVNVAARSFPPPLDSIATSLALGGARDLRRSVLAAELAARTAAAAATFADRGLAPWLDEISKLDVLARRRVRVGDVVGIASGVAPSGELAIRSDSSGVVYVSSGHVEIVGD
jgi:BirA family biotin operon repressor/biotin-[acetyl-CoA-carboxylase] ligase